MLGGGNYHRVTPANLGNTGSPARLTRFENVTLGVIAVNAVCAGVDTEHNDADPRSHRRARDPASPAPLSLTHIITDRS